MAFDMKRPESRGKGTSHHQARCMSEWLSQFINRMISVKRPSRPSPKIRPMMKPVRYSIDR